MSNIKSSFYFWNDIQAISQTHQWHAKDYAELCKKITAKIETPGKQFALILKPNPFYTIMILKYDLISFVGSGYQSKWCSIQWMHQWEVQSDQFKKWSLTCWNTLEGDLRRATNTLYFTTSESYILPISHNTLKKMRPEIFPNKLR